MSSIWYAKPSDGYTASSPEGTSNIRAFYDYLYGEGFAYGAVVGMLCNVAAESSYNPWIWEGNEYGLTRGYGLFQFTPASAYLLAQNVPHKAPNLSTTMQTAGSSPDDAMGQLYCFVNDTLGKWNDTCWRPYWDPAHLPDYYSRCMNILALYGQNGHLSMDDFKIINDIRDASDAFLACYEGPREDNVHPDDRYANHVAIEAALEGYVPVPPGPGSLTDILLLKHFIDKNRK